MCGRKRSTALNTNFCESEIAMSASNPQNASQSNSGWYGPFYSSRQDRRVWVRKRWGYGWTFNFARPGTYAILLAILVVPLVIGALVYW